MSIHHSSFITHHFPTVLIKPAGPDCNLACRYCFYSPKAALYPDTTRHRMSPETLERFLSEYLPVAGLNPTFGWQGGEPTLMGLDFFRKAVSLQRRLGQDGQVVGNGLQTNGALIDREWAGFVARWKFLVGISLDGPAEVHNRYRVNHGGQPSLDLILKGLRHLQRQGAEFNALVMVTSYSAPRADEVWDFLVGLGVRHLQFIPCVEADPQTGELSEFTVSPDAYGDFLCRAYDRWVADDAPNVFVRDFDDLLHQYVRGTSPTCLFQERCGSYFVLEHNGDVYACDFFVEPEWRLGNVMKTPLTELVSGPLFGQFADRKAELGETCQACEWVSLCHGACPRHRLFRGGQISDPSYLCAGYKQLFAHTKPAMEQLVEELRPQRGLRRWKRTKLPPGLLQDDEE